jgi:putative sterol carrier protein
MASVAELFEKMPSMFDAEKAGNFTATVQIDLSGEGGGQWVVAIADGQCTVEEGSDEEADATVHMEASDYVDMMSGDLNPMQAFIQQKVKVEGDLNAVMKFQGLFGP